MTVEIFWETAFRKLKEVQKKLLPAAVNSQMSSAQNNPHATVVKGSRICRPKICRFGILIILSGRHLKTSKDRERLSLNCPYLLNDRSSRRNSLVTDLLGVTNWAQIDSSRERRLKVRTTPRQPLSQTTTPLSDSSGVGGRNFPYKSFTLHSEACFPPPFPIWMAFNPEF